MPWIPTVNDMMGGTLLNTTRNNLLFSSSTYNNTTRSNYDSFDETDNSISHEIPKEINERLSKIYVEDLCNELEQQIKCAESIMEALKRKE
jgi:hypothetical protein